MNTSGGGARLLIRLAKMGEVFWGQAVVAVATFAGIRLYTEILTKAEFGHSMLVMGLIALLDSLMGMALSQTILSRCGAHEDREHRRHLSIGLAWLLGRNVALVALGVSAILGIAALCGWVSPLWIVAPIVGLVYVLAEFAKHSLLTLIILDRDYRRYSAWTAGEAILTLICTSLTLIFWRADAVGYIAGYVVSRVISATLFLLLFSAGRHLKRFDPAIARADAQQALSYGAPVSMMGPLGWVATYLDRYVLGAMLGAAATGTYAAATGLVSRPYALTTSVLSNYFRPLYYQPGLDEAGPAGRRRILRDWAASALIIGGAGAAAFALLGGLIANIMLAPDYRAGAPTLMAIFAVSQMLAIGTHSADNAVLALRGSGILLKVQIALSVATLVLIPLGIVVGGLLGGAIGRCLAEAVKFTVTAILAMRMIDRNAKQPPLATSLRPQTVSAPGA
jgi:O-antigen/teichoic acid export membrane protein